jgi:hypothetical protein
MDYIDYLRNQLGDTVPTIDPLQDPGTQATSQTEPDFTEDV